METIKSFQVDHLNLSKGIYLSAKYCNTTTFDCRLRKPYKDSPIDPAAMHTIEHCLATIARNSSIKDKVIYVGGMACLTGCYVVVNGSMTVQEFIPHFLSWCQKLLETNTVPGATKIQCGNAEFQNLPLAKQCIKDFLQAMIDKIPHEYKYIE